MTAGSSPAAPVVLRKKRHVVETQSRYQSERIKENGASPAAPVVLKEESGLQLQVERRVLDYEYYSKAGKFSKRS